MVSVAGMQAITQFPVAIATGTIANLFLLSLLWHYFRGSFQAKQAGLMTDTRSSRQIWTLTAGFAHVANKPEMQQGLSLELTGSGQAQRLTAPAHERHVPAVFPSGAGPLPAQLAVLPAGLWPSADLLLAPGSAFTSGSP